MGVPDKAETITCNQLVLPAFAVALKATPCLRSTTQPLMYWSNDNVGIKLPFLHVWDTTCCLLYCIWSTKLSHASYCLDPSFDTSPGKDRSIFCAGFIVGGRSSNGCSAGLPCSVGYVPPTGDRSRESKCKFFVTSIAATASDIRLINMHLNLRVLRVIFGHFVNNILTPVERLCWKKETRLKLGKINVNAFGK